MIIDMNTCKPGDKLTTRDGRIGTYNRKISDNIYPHQVTVGPGNLLYTNEGRYTHGCAEDLDIVKIEHLETPDVVTLAGFKMPEVKPRREDSRGPEYGYYECDPLPRNDPDGRGRFLVTRYDSTDALLWSASVLGECLQAFMSDQP
jgi:hypothetical protein